MAKSQLDLTQFCEHELIELNQKIVERLRFLRDTRAHHQMLKLAPGQKVRFTTQEGSEVEGVIIRFNRKSVSLVSTDGVSWRVAPALLSPVEPKEVKEVQVEVSEPVKNEAVRPQQPMSFRMVPLTTAFSSISVDVPRNAPCPCGSGKKHKRCCLLKTAAGNH